VTSVLSLAALSLVGVDLVQIFAQKGGDVSKIAEFEHTTWTQL
jgi:hypothetical protein